MALYSGNNIFYADLIASSISKSTYLRIIDSLVGNRIGQIKMTLNNTKPTISPPTQVNWSTIASVMGADKSSFDGWVYANGAMISKTDFPEIGSMLSRINYPNKINQVSQITLPNICTFIKLKPWKSGVSTTNTIVSQSASYTSPAHTHPLTSSIGSSSSEITVKRAAWIWSTAGNGADGERGETIFNDGRGHIITIPHSPVMHEGYPGETGKVITWDIPVVAEFNNNDMPFSSDTTWFSSANEYYPTHVRMPALIYIGRSFE